MLDNYRYLKHDYVVNLMIETFLLKIKILILINKFELSVNYLDFFCNNS